MERWVGRVAVVTGASAGIGAAIAYQLQDAGVNVVALARRKEKIQVAVEEARKGAESRGRTSIGKTSKPGKLHCLQCDISKEDDVIAAFNWIKNNLGVIHILVNNAGVAKNTKLWETNTDHWRSILDTNVFGLSLCTREAVQLMKAKGVDDGHIIHIGSVVGHKYLSRGGLQMYSASKHAVRVLTEGLRKELVAAKSKIRVTEVSPGFVKTEIINEETVPKVFLESMGLKKPEDLYNVLPHMQSEDVSDAVLYAISTPPHVQIHEIIMYPVGES